MAELMLINPRKRRKHKAKKSVRKNPQKRRTMTALQRKYFGKRKHKRVATVAKKSTKRRRRYAVTASKRRKYRRNPGRGLGKFSMQGFAKNTLMPSAIGAAGALGLDILIGFLPLPANLKTGPMRSVVRIAGAVALGIVAGMVVKKETAANIAAGAVTVTLYDVLKGAVQTAMPTLQLGETDIFTEYPSLAYAGAGETVNGMGMYETGDDMGMYVGESSDVTEQY
jgi:hypothetical protein